MIILTWLLLAAALWLWIWAACVSFKAVMLVGLGALCLVLGWGVAR